MQEEKRQIVINSLAKTIKRLRGDKSQYNLGLEYGIPSSVINNIEHGEKDPQYTTIFRIANALNLTFSEFAKELEKELPENFNWYDD